MPTIATEGASVNYERVGEGPALVFVHPNPFDHSVWLYQIARFQRWFSVVTIDLRGYGRSSRGSDVSIEALSDDLRHVLDHLGISKAILVGMSVGGCVVQQFAATETERTLALVVVGSSASGQATTKFMDARIEGYSRGDLRDYYVKHLHELTAPGFSETPTGRYLLRMFAERGESLHRESLLAIFECIKRWSVEDRLRHVDVPALYMAGEQDPALAHTREASKLIRGARFEIVPGGGHVCALEVPDEFDRRLIKFLDQHGLIKPTVIHGKQAGNRSTVANGIE